MTSSKKNTKPTPILTSSTKHPKAKTKIKLFILNYKTFWVFRGFEQLSSSISWRVVAFSQNDQGYLLWDLNLYPIFGLWAIILAPDMLESW